MLLQKINGLMTDGRTAILTIGAMDTGLSKLQVTVTLKPGENEKDVKGFVPFVATGSAQELDEALPGLIGEYIETFQGVQSNIGAAKAAMKEAEKEIRDAAEAKKKEAAKKGGKPAKPAKKVPETGDLFAGGEESEESKESEEEATDGGND